MIERVSIWWAGRFQPVQPESQACSDGRARELGAGAIVLHD
jgi:hypothetical protein